MLEKDSLDFSFSGLKTAVKREIDKRIEWNEILWEASITWNPLPIDDILAPVKNLYSMDNAAMVGIRAYYEIWSHSL